MPLHHSGLFRVPPAFPPPSDLCTSAFPLLGAAEDTEGNFHIQTAQGKARILNVLQTHLHTIPLFPSTYSFSFTVQPTQQFQRLNG